MSATADAAPLPGGSPHELPGDLAMWMFIFAELAVFALLFAAFAFARASHPAQFAAGEAALPRGLALAQTLLLLSSGYAVARAVRAIGAARAPACTRWLQLAIALGLGFVALKLGEFHADAARGVSLSSGLFDMFYLGLCFFHFMHVLMGLVILGVVAWKARAGHYRADSHAGVETAGSYWHMVDLLWLVLFFLLYVSR